MNIAVLLLVCLILHISRYKSVRNCIRIQTRITFQDYIDISLFAVFTPPSSSFASFCPYLSLFILHALILSLPRSVSILAFFWVHSLESDFVYFHL